MKKEETITFSGKESELLTSETLQRAYDLLKCENKEKEIESISENLSKEKWELFFKSFGFSKNEFNSGITYLYGFPIYKKKYVPLDEMWFVEKDGLPIKKFKF